MAHPYTALPESAFWRSAIGDRNALHVTGLWEPKAPISRQEKIATFGSCFAQHIGKALGRRGFNWHDGEPGPKLVGETLSRQYNYGIFSARTANIYTTKALRQWIDWALGAAPVPEEVWERKGRFYDPFRPTIEPNGFGSVEELRRSREVTLAALRNIVKGVGLFVFTLGLTEAWENIEGGHVYAVCPGTMGGTFDPAQHRFVNYDYEEVMAELTAALGAISRANPAIRFLLTVSPVPLTATAAGKHVLVSTTYSKSVLRAVAGRLADRMDNVDYFPSYEIITAPSFRGMFYEPNMREVAPAGVAFVMDSFFEAMNRKFPMAPVVSAAEPIGEPPQDQRDQAVCEEQMLAAFAPRAPQLVS